MKKYLFVALSLVISMQSYGSDFSSVKSTMLFYQNALKTYDSVKMAEMMHPDALARFRNAFNAAFNGHNSKKAQKELLPLFLVSNIDEYNRLSNIDAYRRLNDAVKKSQPKLVDMMKSSKMEIIGETIKGDITIVTYTLGFNVNGRHVAQDTLQKLKLHNGKWLLLLPPSSEATIVGIESSF